MRQQRRFMIFASIVSVWIGLSLCNAATPRLRPNIVVLVADDLGYGELQCLNPNRGKIKTPHLDRLAESGMIFTDAHSGSSVCTPSRYGLLTGRYAWRTRLQSGVLQGGPSLIAADRLTMAKMLRERGYRTAALGKWHLGMLFDGKENSGRVQLGSQVTEGPLDRGGFDHFHGFHHSRQMDVWIDDNQVTAHVAAEQVLPQLTTAATDFIEQNKDGDQPFFLYLAWNAPHSPVAPSPEWQGRSGLNAHADFVMQLDDCCGQVLRTLEATGLSENTLVVFTSDNGTSPTTSEIARLQSMGHYPSGPYRGAKADLWEGGHRVPFFVRWPGVIPAKRSSDSLICLNDLMATLAELIQWPLSEHEAEDSISFLDVLTGQAAGSRPSVIHHSIDGYFAIRRQQWKLLLCPGSGGWSAPRTTSLFWQDQISAGLPLTQLYDFSNDLEEQQNLAGNPSLYFEQLVDSLRKELTQLVEHGRSTHGNHLRNDVPVIVDKRPEF
jgi:arylsulfatase A